MTIRRRMVELLEEDMMDGRALSSRLGIREKEVYDHLDHIRRSVIHKGKQLKVLPAECRACGYVFKDRQRLTPPGRCPRCRQTRGMPPAFVIEE